MNRRFFLRSLSLVTGALFLPLRSKAPEITPPVPPFYYHKGLRAVLPNREYAEAPYEIGFVVCGEHRRVIKDPWPWRFRNAESAQHFIRKMNEVYKGC